MCAPCLGGIRYQSVDDQGRLQDGCFHRIFLAQNQECPMKGISEEGLCSWVPTWPCPLFSDLVGRAPVLFENYGLK